RDSYSSAVSETIRQSELRNHNAEIMRRVAEGESFTVTVHGQPVADLVPHQRDRAKPRAIPAAALDEALAAAGPGPDPELWERDMAALDALVDDDLVDPWER
ncbi:MAG: type II toxin-antitoxin system Phd/YefM family antitoxin, partial [Pseudonocardia sp.]